MQCNVLGHNAATDSAPPSKYGSMLFACDRQKVEERCLSVSVKSESLFREIYHTLKVDGENERYRGEVGGKLGGDGAECRERHNCVYRGAYFTRVLCRGRERILRNGRLPSNGVVVDYCTYTERCKYVHIHKRMCMCMCMYVYVYVYVYVCVCVCVCMVMFILVYTSVARGSKRAPWGPAVRRRNASFGTSRTRSQWGIKL